MQNRLLWISSVVVAVLALGLIELSHGQLLYLPAVWGFPHIKAPQAVAAASIPSHSLLPPGGARLTSEVRDGPPPKYLDSYFPAAMQLLHYFSERMQYAERHSTTVAPPYTGGDYGAGASPVGTTPQTTTSRPTPMTTTTTYHPPQVESTTQTHAPGLFAPIPPKQPILQDSPPRKPWATTTTTTKRPIVTRRTTSTTRKPWTSTTTWKPWTSTTTQKPWTTTRRVYTTKWKQPVPDTTDKRPLGPDSLAATNGFFNWFFEKQRNVPKQRQEEQLYDILDPLPKSILNEIENEGLSLPALRDEDNVREFLKKFDDKFNRFVPSQTGDRRMPPTKPFVEFLVLYDLMKREAKEKNYGEYHGYTDNILTALYASSKLSSERQLHFVLSQLSASTEMLGAGIKSRMDTIIKDLETPTSVTSQTLREIPAFVFAP